MEKRRPGDARNGPQNGLNPLWSGSFLPTPPHGGVVWFTGGPFRPPRRVGRKPRRIRAVRRLRHLGRRALGSRAFQSQPVRTPGVSSWVRRNPLELSESRVDGRRG